MEVALKAARENRNELNKFLNHYSYGSIGHQAAVFIIESLIFRESFTGEMIEIFRDSVYNWNGKTSLTGIWENIEKNHTIKYQADIRKLKAEYLIRNTDDALQAWENSLWKDSISFEIFKEYILPYAVANEPVTAWRNELREKYGWVIEGIESPKVAFDRLYNHINSKFRFIDGMNFRCIMDPIMIDRTMRGTCATRTLLIVYAARALGIPAAYDYVEYWANYSTSGHSWPVCIGGNEEVFFMSDNQSVSSDKGFLEASYFPAYYLFDDSPSPFKIDSLKRAAKIFRRSFSTRSHQKSASNTPRHLKSHYIHDVSSLYGFHNTLSVRINERVKE
ncbi:MAG: hypothetical protein LUD68_08655, partial [Rikenellaceae bacterium]|nr:hypothetical protein [Rikenellaceae bacterium]